MKKKTLYIIIIVINVLASLIFNKYEISTNKENDVLFAYADSIGNEATKKLEKEISQTMSLVDSLKDTLKNEYTTFTSALNDSSRLISDLKKLTKQLPNIDEIYVAYYNGKKSEIKKLYSVYYHKIEGSLKYDHIEDYYDFCSEDTCAKWFHDAIEADSSIWTGPYLAKAGNKRFMSYDSPANLQDSFIFVVGISYSTTSLYSLINSWKFARIGFPYLMTKDGMFLAHPNDECKTLKTIGIESNELTLVNLANEIINDTINNKADFDPTKYYHRNTISNKMCWEKVIPLKEPDWFLGFSITDQQIYRNPQFFNKQRKEHIRQTLFVFIALLVVELLLIWWFFGKKEMDFRINMFTICSILFFVLLFTYHYSLKYPLKEISNNDCISNNSISNNSISNDSIFNDSIWNSSMLLDKYRVNDYIAAYDKQVKSKKNTHLVKIPTGIYVQTIKFLDSYSAKLTGYIWQIYPPTESENIGVSFPDAETYSMEKIDSLSIFLPNGEAACLYRWYFTMEIRESFNYKIYPFNKSDLWIRLWSKNFDKNQILLTPDINSYLLFHPSYRPGIDKDIVIPGWNIEASYFSYKEKNYYTNFGATNHFSKNSFPELHFNIRLKRNFIDPLISRIIPLAVLLLMTFSILYISKKEDALNVAIACSGLLFVAVFEHINLRKTLDMPGIIYLEYFYFITYLLLMLVAVNVSVEKWIIKCFGIKVLCADLIQKSYWFIALFILFIVTLYTFY